METEPETDFAAQVADLNRYGQALNRCESVEEVVSLTLEAASLLFGSPYSTFYGVRDEELRVVHSTNPNVSSADRPSRPTRRAFETGETTVVTGSAARVGSDGSVTAALAVPASIGDEVKAVLVLRSTDDGGEETLDRRPIEILASHAATAIENIQSRERLERARRDLERRKDIVEMYDRLLRHDLGNDLQVIAGLAEVLADDLDGDQAGVAGRIRDAAWRSADRVDRVGDVVSTFEQEDGLRPTDLGPVLEAAATSAANQYEELTVATPDDPGVRVYAGELLESVFENLFSNAAGHNDGPVGVTVSVTTDDGRVRVRVADDGEGIPEEVRSDLFAMGTKGPDSTGTGLGLGFVRALVESYGGAVGLADDDATGAAFTVRLDRA